MEGLLTGLKRRKERNMEACKVRTCLKELKSIIYWRDVICEFIASFFYSILVCGLNFDWTLPSSMHVALSTGLGVAMLAHMFWDLSGGHFNPALSIAMVFARKLSFLRGVGYVIAQVLGSLAGVGALHLLTPASLRGAFAHLYLGEDVTPVQGFFMEIILTSIMMWTILVSIRPDKNYPAYIAPLAIGLCVGVNLFIGLPYTGAAMNPIRAFGPALASGNWDHHWIYWAGPIVGAIGTVGLYYLINDVMTPKEHLYKDEGDVVKNQSGEEMQAVKA